MRTHVRNLFRLGLNYQFQSRKPEEFIFNFSSCKLYTIQKVALALDLGFCFNPIKLDYTKHFVAFEKLCKFLTSNPIFRGNVDSLPILRAKIKNLAFHCYYSFKYTQYEHHKTLKYSSKELSQNKDLINTAPDKGAGVVIMNKSD